MDTVLNNFFSVCRRNPHEWRHTRALNENIAVRIAWHSITRYAVEWFITEWCCTVSSVAYFSMKHSRLTAYLQINIRWLNWSELSFIISALGCYGISYVDKDSVLISTYLGTLVQWTRCTLRQVHQIQPNHLKMSSSHKHRCLLDSSTSTSTSTSTSKSFIEKIHRHIFNNHETETHEGLFASFFHGLSLHCKYSNLCWKSWLVQVHWNNKTCAWRSICNSYYYCKYRD